MTADQHFNVAAVPAQLPTPACQPSVPPCTP